MFLSLLIERLRCCGTLCLHSLPPSLSLSPASCMRSSGKTTFLSVLMERASYGVTEGSVRLRLEPEDVGAGARSSYSISELRCGVGMAGGLGGREGGGRYEAYINLELRCGDRDGKQGPEGRSGERASSWGVL